MTRTLPPCAPAAPWARPRTATTSPSAPEGGSPTYWCTPIAQGCESLEVYILSKQLLLSLVDHCAAHNIPSFSTGVLQAMVPAQDLPIRL
ncbi:hypothetical protein M5E87_00885 [Flavonifractor plautii]|nr:hypothetical protein M5E87_00885 [Flavonifractor plautii]